MAGSIYTYDFDENGVSIVTQVQQEEIRQEGIDESQNAKIKENTDLNNVQTILIKENSDKNHEQDLRMDDLQEQIKHVSGGTITDLDAGTW